MPEPSMVPSQPPGDAVGQQAIAAREEASPQGLMPAQRPAFVDKHPAPGVDGMASAVQLAAAWRSEASPDMAPHHAAAEGPALATGVATSGVHDGGGPMAAKRPEASLALFAGGAPGGGLPKNSAPLVDKHCGEVGKADGAARGDPMQSWPGADADATAERASPADGALRPHKPRPLKPRSLQVTTPRCFGAPPRCCFPSSAPSACVVDPGALSPRRRRRRLRRLEGEVGEWGDVMSPSSSSKSDMPAASSASSPSRPSNVRSRRRAKSWWGTLGWGGWMSTMSAVSHASSARSMSSSMSLHLGP
mmetsp:Transcript_22985/g.66591  ORF Transcript_22985/g.66591 Transcript_22985/m.66591 type:complete len:305 (-) Transcript_22985:624-1538(-)